MAKDLYSVLGVAPWADAKEIRSAYRALARKLHPDIGAGSSEERFRAIQDAYDVLSDPERRRLYDSARQRHAAPRYGSWIPEARLDSRPSHIDLRDLSSPARGEPIRFSAGAPGERHMRPAEPLSEIQALFRLFDDLFF